MRRFQIGKHAAENGVAATMRFYAKKFVLKESSVRTWKNAYTRVFELARACDKRQSQPGIVGGAVLEQPFAKIRPRNL